MIQEIEEMIIHVINHYFNRQEQSVDRATAKAMESIPKVMEQVVGSLPKLMKDIEEAMKTESD